MPKAKASVSREGKRPWQSKSQVQSKKSLQREKGKKSVESVGIGHWKIRIRRNSTLKHVGIEMAGKSTIFAEM
jgi:hypothetical protein